MTQYIQYDEDGNITAVIISECTAPDHAQQIFYNELQEVRNKKIDTGTWELVDVPCPEPTPESVE